MENYLILKGNQVDVTGAPALIPILPLGYVVSSRGNFYVDDESLREMRARIAQHGVDLVVDYEHQTLSGEQAPAAGWVKEIILKDGKIQAYVDWTKKARAYLESCEYRYISPVITVRKNDRKAIGLHSIALTNTPAIEGMAPIVNSQYYFEKGQSSKEKEFIKKVAQMLKLPETASVEEIMKEISSQLSEFVTKEDDRITAFKNNQIDYETVRICKMLGVSTEDCIKYGQGSRETEFNKRVAQTTDFKNNQIDYETLRMCKMLGVSTEDCIKYGYK